MFLCKRARQDVLPGIVFLAIRVKDPNQQNYIKLVKLMNYLKATENEIPKMSADDSQTIKWYVDSSFTVHNVMRSHTGAIMTLRKGAVISDSTKQKVNAQSSTESEMIAVNNIISKILWTKWFIEAQGFPVKANIIYQDNTSTMKLEVNGNACWNRSEIIGKITRKIKKNIEKLNSTTENGRTSQDQPQHPSKGVKLVK